MQEALMTGYRAVLESGRTKPILIQAVDREGNHRELVAKITSKQFDKGALTRELVASKLACRFGLETPEPVLLNVPRNFRELNLPSSVEAAIEGGFFPTFATQYLPMLSAFISGKKLNERHIPVACEIFTFDSMIVNRDRSEFGSVNCLTDSNRFVLIDHETALDGRLIGSSMYVEPWKPRALRPMCDVLKHIFFDSIAGRECDFTPVAEKWRSLSHREVDQVLADVPAVWEAEERALESIRRYLHDLVDNMDGALREVEAVLQ